MMPECGVVSQGATNQAPIPISNKAFLFCTLFIYNSGRLSANFRDTLFSSQHGYYD